jgi:uncharacterized protein (TIGR03435 family)
MMKKTPKAIGIASLVITGMLAAYLHAQSPTGANRPKFDVASVKLNKSNGGPINLGNLGAPGGLYRTTNITLQVLISRAYDIKSHTFIAAPEWDHILSEHFDIEARAEGNPDIDEKRLMVQSLLEDRFKLQMHHEMRSMPFYALILSKPGKTGSRLSPHSDEAKCLDMGGPPPRFPVPGQPLPGFCGGFIVYVKPGDAHASGNNVTMDMLVSQLSGFVDRPVLDQTRLGGTFEVDLEFIPLQGPGVLPPNASPTDASGPAELFTAIQEQLGLKLEPQTGPVDVLVLDQIDEPSEN